MLRLADRGDASDGVHTAPGGCLLADIMPSRTFKQPTPYEAGYSAAVYSLNKSLAIHLRAQNIKNVKKKPPLTPDRPQILRNNHTHRNAATLLILFSLSSRYIPSKKTPYSGFVFVTK